MCVLVVVKPRRIPHLFLLACRTDITMCTNLITGTIGIVRWYRIYALYKTKRSHLHNRGCLNSLVVIMGVNRPSVCSILDRLGHRTTTD